MEWVKLLYNISKRKNKRYVDYSSV